MAPLAGRVSASDVRSYVRSPGVKRKYCSGTDFAAYDSVLPEIQTREKPQKLAETTRILRLFAELIMQFSDAHHSGVIEHCGTLQTIGHWTAATHSEKNRNARMKSQ